MCTLLERRLTPEGAELIRSELIGTGLFDFAQPPPSEDLQWSYIQVRNGDELVYVNEFGTEVSERLGAPWR